MTNKKIIFCLTGEICAGKGTVVKYLTKKYNATSYRFSTMLRDLLTRLYIPVSRENMQFISTAIRQFFSEDIMAKVIAQDVKNDKNNIIVVDGVRRVPDIKYLCDVHGFKLVRIVANPKTRHKRLINRKENPGDENKTYEEFLADHKKEADSQVPIVMAQANLEIDNNNSLKNLYKQVDQIILNS
ncbi:AAA family ATPase [Patescibacteria group bacterium]|nr:AAA family ATPase [Patescibacteria group bacterium]MBU1663537.1 AAA family ATPase [Patescibacteria group bacterium]MBU1933799.1 AAA family ATPase [Patescibacteria group bacterium]MBU2007809.1 AAA family ATPase [Patescibacteria group bacterium]MBU2233441.1 AAA family ATPase [Patescibacteria group bacterium]